MALEPNVSYVFRPKPDITVAELAEVLQLVLNLQGSVFKPTLMTQVPEHCLKHFVSQSQTEMERMLYLGSSTA